MAPRFVIILAKTAAAKDSSDAEGRRLRGKNDVPIAFLSRARYECILPLPRVGFILTSATKALSFFIQSTGSVRKHLP